MVTRLDTTSTVRRNPDVVGRGLAEAEGGVLLHLTTGAYHGLNPVGLVIWDLLEHDQTVADLVAGVRDRVDDAPPTLEQDVLAFLDHASARDLIRIDP
jgi:hypothetical protein